MFPHSDPSPVISGIISGEDGVCDQLLSRFLSFFLSFGNRIGIDRCMIYCGESIDYTLLYITSRLILRRVGRVVIDLLGASSILLEA